MIGEAGFTDIHFSILKRPTSDWPKDPIHKKIGLVHYQCSIVQDVADQESQLTNRNYMDGLEAFTMALFTRVHGWKPEEVHILLAQIRAEWNNRRIHGWQKG